MDNTVYALLIGWLRHRRAGRPSVQLLTEHEACKVGFHSEQHLWGVGTRAGWLQRSLHGNFLEVLNGRFSQPHPSGFLIADKLWYVLSAATV